MFRGLKTKIAFNIAVLLLVGMLLMVLVTMVSVKRELIRSEISRARILLVSLEDNLVNGMPRAEGPSDLIPESFITRMINDSQISKALVIGKNGEKCYLGTKSAVSRDELVGYTQKAISSGQKQTRLFGTSWSIFWKDVRTFLSESGIMGN